MSSVSNFMALSNSEICFFNATVYENFQQHEVFVTFLTSYLFIPELEYGTYDIMKIMKASVSQMVNVTLPSVLDCVWCLTSD